MILNSSSSIWKDIERRDSKERIHLLQWQLQAREPIRRFSDMKAGDHLVKKGFLPGGSVPHEHHFLCVGFDCGKPKIIHYHNTESHANVQMIRTSSLGSGTALEQLGLVQEMTLPHKDFIKNEDELQAEGKEVERVVWPEELKRFSVQEVIGRAWDRIGEKFVHLTKNKCESFVMWCLCGLNIALQATIDMALSSSVEIWKWIENLGAQEQNDQLQWQLQAREPIRRFADIKLGDHLVTKGSIVPGLFEYEHHCLCIGFSSDGSPKIIHYYNTPSNASRTMSSTGSLGSGTSLGKLGIIQETTLPDSGFITEDKLKAKEDDEFEWAMARVVWPDEMRRYSVEEIVERAEKRKEETFYHLMKNNCESFVMWCLCGLNITLQATPLRKALFEGSSALLKAGVRGVQQGIKAVIKEGVQFVDDILVQFTGGSFTESAVGKFVERALPELKLDGGLVLAVVVEIGGAGKDIYNAYKKWTDGKVIQSSQEFVKEVAGILLGACSRPGISAAGMTFIGGLVGAVLGVIGGHLLARLVSYLMLGY